MYGKVYGFLLVIFASTFGASGCFFVSTTLAKYWVFKFFPNRILQFKNMIEDNKDNLFFYILFLRITPFFPNWLLNLSTPIVGVPYFYFFTATIFGLIPANIMHVTMGSEIANVDKLQMNMNFVLTLIFLSIVALIPIVVKKVFINKFKHN